MSDYNTSTSQNPQENSLSRDFKGIWIPRDVWLRQDISCGEKCLLAEIDSLYDSAKGGCYASNSWFMKFLDVKERRLQEMLANLKSKGLIEYKSFDGRQRVMVAVFTPVKVETTHLRDAEKCTPQVRKSAPIDISLDKENISLKVQGAPAQSAKASVEIFSDEVIQTSSKMLEALVKAKPDAKPVKNIPKFRKSVNALLKQGRKPDKILKVFTWALQDKFWSSKMFNPNPAEYLDTKFDQLEVAMTVDKTPKTSAHHEGRPVEEDPHMSEALRMRNKCK